ncbi:MAG: TadE/TadG family type IV pilus assembly protein [Acidimicrobiales bacterium]
MTTEFVILTPILLSFLCLVILTGRMVDARSDIIGAANDAARVASLQDTGGSAAAQAQLAATDSVNGERLNCAGGGPDVQTQFLPDGDFVRGGTVHVTVECTVNTSDLAFTNFIVPASFTITEEAWEPIDAHRSL